MPTPVTDYTQALSDKDKGMPLTLNGPSRMQAYMVDLLKTWFGNPENIPDDQLRKLIPYKVDKTLSGILVDSGYPEDQRFIDKTPSCSVFSQGIEYSQESVYGVFFNNHGGVAGSGAGWRWGYPIQITLRIQSYPAASWLMEYLSAFLLAFSEKIQTDTKVSSFRVASSTFGKERQPGDSKDVYTCTILCLVRVALPVVVDSVGPTLKCDHVKQ